MCHKPLGPVVMLLIATAGTGCVTVSSRLHALESAEMLMTREIEMYCLVRQFGGQMTGTLETIDVGTVDGKAAVTAATDGAVFGRAEARGHVVTYGQICYGSGGCSNTLFYETPASQVWLDVATSRRADNEQQFFAYLDEDYLVQEAMAFLPTPQVQERFDEVASDLRAARITKAVFSVLSSIVEIVPGIGDLMKDITSGVFDITGAVTGAVLEGGATVDANLYLARMLHFLNKHDIMLYGGVRGGWRLFERANRICAVRRLGSDG